MSRKNNGIRGIIFLVLVTALGFSGILPTQDHDEKAIPYLAQKISDIRDDRAEERLNLKTLEDIYDGLDYESVIDTYSSKLKGDFSITKFQYFAVFSNLDDELTYQLIDNDIRNTVTGMINSYLDVKPNRVTGVFLFEDEDSYADFSQKTFNISDNDLSPYGFYKISKNVIVVRYVSWKGSLPHEVTHAMIQNDFPDMPSWFNEGLGTMHEKALFINGEMKADFNWRINALRRSINEDTYTGITNMMSTTDEQVYGKRSSFYYAQARYLLGYLQDKGLLKKYYKHFNNSFESDRTGITQIETVLGKDVAEIDKDFLTYIKSFTQEMKR